MIRKLTSLLAVVAFTAATLTPVTASAQRRHDGYDRGGYGYGYDCRDSRYGCDRRDDRRYRGHRHRDRDDDDDAIVAGVVGLALGAVLATAIANSGNNNNDRRYNDGYRQDDGYYRDDNGYQQCTQQVRRWDERYGRYIIVEEPC